MRFRLGTGLAILAAFGLVGFFWSIRRIFNAFKSGKIVPAEEISTLQYEKKREPVSFYFEIGLMAVFNVLSVAVLWFAIGKLIEQLSRNP